ncbi:MAG: 30S ribosomal protein S8e [Nanoarchaeota archaeon]|nr:30S ribosomal protein S8e [Nanoarchaeota archaeon]
MVIIQSKSKRKPTGGKYKRTDTKRLHQKGRTATHTKLDETKISETRIKGGNIKQNLLSVDTINVWDPKTKKHYKEKIKSTSDNPANRHFARRSIITKGAIVETAKGKARITSRPGQDTVVNAVLIA